MRKTCNHALWQIVMTAQRHDTFRQKRRALNLYIQPAQEFPLYAEPLIGIAKTCYDAAIKYMVENSEFGQAKMWRVIMTPGDRAKDILVYAKSCFDRNNRLGGCCSLFILSKGKGSCRERPGDFQFIDQAPSGNDGGKRDLRHGRGQGHRPLWSLSPRHWKLCSPGQPRDPRLLPGKPYLGQRPLKTLSR